MFVNTTAADASLHFGGELHNRCEKVSCALKEPSVYMCDTGWLMSFDESTSLAAIVAFGKRHSSC